ncbi:hypothetical protein IWX46DRAFT_371474 [Phyllosticta citricarpa]|uniref:Secreted protein n=1 Tax=Phyllosticta citricarpa TaxID=55181 RepID=A0ABR1L9T6_9PEZI
MEEMRSSRANAVFFFFFFFSRVATSIGRIWRFRTISATSGQQGNVVKCLARPPSHGPFWECCTVKVRLVWCGVVVSRDRNWPNTLIRGRLSHERADAAAAAATTRRKREKEAVCRWWQKLGKKDVAGLRGKEVEEEASGWNAGGAFSPRS